MAELVSICVFSYNNAPFLRETLDSILHQTYSPIELIIVDDASSDGSWNVIDTWVEKHQRLIPIKLHRNQHNKGVTYSCNQALKYVNGSYVVMFGSDDVMLPDRITHQVLQLKILGLNYLALSNDVLLIDEIGDQIGESFYDKLQKPRRKEPGDISLRDMLDENVIPAPGLIMRKSVFGSVGQYDERLTFEDYDMNLRILTIGKIYWDPQTVAKYRIKRRSLGSRIYHLHADFALIFGKCMRKTDANLKAIAFNKFEHHFIQVLLASRTRARRILASISFPFTDFRFTKYWVFSILPIPRRWLLK